MVNVCTRECKDTRARGRESSGLREHRMCARPYGGTSVWVHTRVLHMLVCMVDIECTMGTRSYTFGSVDGTMDVQ